MKVAVVTAFPRDPERPQGGVEAVSVNLVRALTTQPGVDVVVVTADRDARNTEITRWEGVEIHRLPAFGQRLLSFALGTGRKLVREKLLCIRPDVVHAHDTYGIMVQGLAIPRVFTIHGFIHEDTKFDKSRFASLRAWLWRRAELSSWADHPHLVAINPFVRKQLHGLVRGCIHEIENPIDEGCFTIERAEMPGTIFCAAAIRRLKNTLGLVQAFERIHAEIPTARLRIAGPEIEQDYANEVRSFIQSRGLAQKVSLLGSIQRSQIQVELSRASIFALLSFQENAPMGVSEALAAGVPVVAANRCGMPYMIDDNKTGFLVNPTDTEATSDRFRTLLQDEKLRTEFSSQARDSALFRYHPVGVAEKTCAVYQQAMSDLHPMQCLN